MSKPVIFEFKGFIGSLNGPQIFLGLLALIVIISLLYGIFNYGGTFLNRLQDTNITRGFITFLVAFTTVTIAIILLVYATSSDNNATDYTNRLNAGKDILTALIGILGTILGFYFGSAIRPATEEALNVASAFVANENPKRGETVVLYAFVRGGKPPYIYSILFNPPSIHPLIEDRTSTNGVIQERITMPASITSDQDFTFKVLIKDSSGESMTYDKARKFTVKT